MSCRISVLIIFLKQHLCRFTGQYRAINESHFIVLPLLIVNAKFFYLAAYLTHHEPCIGHYKPMLQTKLNSEHTESIRLDIYDCLVVHGTESCQLVQFIIKCGSGTYITNHIRF